MRFAFSLQDEADRLVAMAGQVTATATQLVERFEVNATGTLVTVNAPRPKPSCARSLACSARSFR